MKKLFICLITIVAFFTGSSAITHHTKPATVRCTVTIYYHIGHKHYTYTVSGIIDSAQACKDLAVELAIAIGAH